MIDEEISKASEEAGATTATKTEPKKPMMWNEFLEQTGKTWTNRSFVMPEKRA